MDSALEGTLREGEVLAGRYRIEALIGSGGYGRVYRAIQLPLGREVAIKVVLADDKELVARFGREASIAQSLEHPNTVKVLDIGETKEGLPFLALELLRGSSVYELLCEQGKLTVEVALEVTAQVLKSLAEAHAKGIVHRDIKPENIFVTSHFGEPVFVKVLDFGIAKRMRGSDKLTVNGEAVGTPNYMPPEQVMGLPTDARTDLYAVGLLLAEMVTGNVVYDGGPRTLLGAQIAKTPAPLEDAIKESVVGPIVERAVRKLPKERYQSAGEMLAAVEAVQRNRGARQTREVSLPTAMSAPPPASPSLTSQATMRSGESSLPTRISPPQAPLPPPPVMVPPSPPLPTAPVMMPPSPPLPPAPFVHVPARASSSGLAVGLTIAGLVTLVIALGAAVLWMSRGDHRSKAESESEEDRPTHKKKATVDEPVDGLDPRVSTLRTVSAVEITRVLAQSGYTITVDNAGDRGLHTWAVLKPPCAGTITLMDLGNELQARSTTHAMLTQEGMAVLIGGSIVVSVTLVRAPGKVDAACSRDAAKLLAR